MPTAELRLGQFSECPFNPGIMYVFFMNTNYQRLALLRNVTSPGQKRPQNERENHFDIGRSDRSVTMPKSVGILLERADRAVTSSKHLHLNKQQ
jgi:hypothetical protein